MIIIAKIVLFGVLVALVIGMMAMVRGAWAFSCSDVTEIPQIECEALVAIYDGTGGDNWNNNTWWKDTNTPCSWYGVRCSNKHVDKIYFDFNYLVG